MKKFLLLLLSATMVYGSAANAAAVINVRQVGSDVVAYGRGSFDLTGAGNFLVAINSGFIRGERGAVAVGGPFGSVRAYPLTTNAGLFGVGGAVDGTPDVGSKFGVSGFAGSLFVPFDYVSGTPLAGSTRFAGHTIASLGLNKGNYVYGIPNDTLTVNIAVPEPASWAMLIAGFGLVGAASRRRRLIAAAA